MLKSWFQKDQYIEKRKCCKVQFEVFTGTSTF